MNPQIEQLARQVEACYIPRYDMWQMDSETLEKFVELIVCECAGLAEEHMIMKRWPCAADAAIYVKKHFGVEP